MTQVSASERREVLADRANGKLVRMTLADGRSRAFDNLTDATRWGAGEENGGQPLPRNDAKLSISLPTEAKEFVRDSGVMSAIGRGLILKAIGAQWKSHKKGAGKKTVMPTTKPPRAKVAKVKAG